MIIIKSCWRIGVCTKFRQSKIFQFNSLNENVGIWVQIPSELIPNVSNDNADYF